MNRSVLKKCRSWNDFTGAVARLPNTKAVGDSFELLTKLTLLSAPEYRTKISRVWLHSEVPREIARKLNLPPPEIGIDAIAETKTGEFWAIQCKYRSASDKALTLDELSTFTNLAFVHCKGISHGLITHTSNKPIKKIAFMGPVTELGLSHWASMEEEAWKAIRALLANKPIKVTKRKPRPHQRKAITAAEKYFKKTSRGKMIMPCGSGKGLAAFWIAERLKAKTIVVAVPSLTLIKFSIQDWTREYLAYGIQPEWLAVCSDDTVGDVSKDQFVSSIYELGIETTTDKSDITAFLKKRSKGVPRIIFTSYQSGPVLSKAVLESRKKIDLLILDEAHKTVGDKEKRFSTLLADSNLPARKRLFMTATERVLAGSDKNERVYSMDDVKVYGEVFYQVTFKQAIEQGLISDYKILTVSISREEIDALIKKNALLKDVGEKDKEYEAAALAAGIALNRTFKKQGVKHAISFHRSIKAAENFAAQQDMLARIGVVDDDIVNGSISSKKSAGERDQQIRDFVASDRALLSNARCLTEGVDIPSIDCVCFASPKQSVIDIVQASGRALRTYEGKKFGYILLPIVIPEDMDFEDYAETTEFKTVARTIAALSVHDERIVEYFRLVQEGKRPSRKVIEIYGSERLGQKIDLKEFSNAIETKVWERVAKVNWRSFNEARDFVQKIGVPPSKWYQYCTGKLEDFEPKPADIPASPELTYLNRGWTDWKEWFGTRPLPFEEARNFARSLGLKSQTEWIKYRRGDFPRLPHRPRNIPTNPWTTYKDQGWVSIGDWLGYTSRNWGEHKWRNFKNARSFARTLGLKGQREWGEYCARGIDGKPIKPDDIPTDVATFYQDKGWKGFGDWLGNTGQPRSSKYFKWRSYEEARVFVHRLGLRTRKEYRTYCRGEFPDKPVKPNDIPTNPETVYEDSGWIGTADWLGFVHPRSPNLKYRPFRDARTFVHSLKLNSLDEWRRYCKGEIKEKGIKPLDITGSPDKTYKGKGWISWLDWLGKK